MKIKIWPKSIFKLVVNQSPIQKGRNVPMSPREPDISERSEILFGELELDLSFDALT